MSNKPRKRSAVALAFGTTIALGAGLAGAAAPGTAKGPSTTTDPYVMPIDPTAVQITSLLTVDDPAPGAGYVVAGLLDGLGAYPDGSGGVTVVAAHEISSGGATRAHGFNGAFFSKHTLTPGTLAVSGSADLMTSVDWSGGTSRASAVSARETCRGRTSCSTRPPGRASTVSCSSPERSPASAALLSRPTPQRVTRRC